MFPVHRLVQIHVHLLLKHGLEMQVAVPLHRIIGAVAARRYTKSAVTTVCIDNLSFLEPAYLNDTVVQEAEVIWTGHTSLEVKVDSYVEHLDGSRMRVNRAYVVFVALDDNDRPKPVPTFTPRTDAEKREFAAAQERRKQRVGK